MLPLLFHIETHRIFPPFQPSIRWTNRPPLHNPPNRRRRKPLNRKLRPPPPPSHPPPHLHSHRQQPPLHSQIKTPRHHQNLLLRHSLNSLTVPKQGRRSIPDHGSNRPTRTSLSRRLPCPPLPPQLPPRFPPRHRLAVEWRLESRLITPPQAPLRPRRFLHSLRRLTVSNRRLIFTWFSWIKFF